MKKVLCMMFLVLNVANLYSMQNYNIEPAVSSGSGGAYTAALNTPETVFYNPAGFYGINKTFISISYNKHLTGFNDETSDNIPGYYPVDINSWYVSLITPMPDLGAVGFTLSSFNFLQLYSLYNLYASFSTELNRFINMKKKVGGGISFKFLMREYGSTEYNKENITMTGMSVDIGGHIILSYNLKVGMSILNLMSSDMGNYDSDSVDRIYKLGGIYSMDDMFIFNRVDFLFDFDYFNNNYNLYFGANSLLLNNNLKLKMGINFNYIGVGVEYLYDFIEFNYALNYYIKGNFSNIINHKISIGLQF